MGVKRRRMAILDSVQTKLLKGVFVPFDNMFAGCNNVLNEHYFFWKKEEMKIDEEGDVDEKTIKQPVDVKFV